MAAKKSSKETAQVRAGRNRRLARGTTGKALIPPNAGKGRAPGAKNKLSRLAKENLEQAFQDLGGVAGLVQWGRSNKTEFYKIWARLIPKDVSVSASDSLEDLLTRLAQPSGDEAPLLDATYTEVHDGPSVVAH